MSEKETQALEEANADVVELDDSALEQAAGGRPLSEGPNLACDEGC